MGWLRNLFRRLFGVFRKKHTRLGLYGPPNSGKTTLANRICADWIGEEMGETSKIAHETREVRVKEKITITNEQGKTITFSLADTPGIATRIDYEDFVREGIPEAEAKKRAKEATSGVVQSISWLDKMDCVIMVLDSSKEPYNQVNTTILDNLKAREIPTLIVANKIDLKKASVDRVCQAFPEYEILGISAKNGDNLDKLYEKLFELTAKAV
jgi:small GTP-binding protein